MHKNQYKEHIEKYASIGNALNRAGKFTGRTLTGAAIGAGIGSMKAMNANSVPGMDQENKETNLAGGMIGGAILGGLTGGVGVGAAKKIGKKITPGFLKKSEMEVPTDKEKGLEEEDDEDIKESPTEKEKSRMRHSINAHKKEIEKYSLNKIAKYMNDIKCEECGFEGTPDSSNGRCPNCGALGGVKPKPNPSYTASNSLRSKDETIGKLIDEMYAARQGIYSM